VHHPTFLSSVLPGANNSNADGKKEEEEEAVDETERVALEREAFHRLLGVHAEHTLFPTLFPYGASGTWDIDRHSPLSFDRYVVHRLQLPDGRFRTSCDWLGWAFLVSKKLHEALAAANFQLHPRSFVLTDNVWEHIGVKGTADGGATAFDTMGRIHYYHF